VERNPQIGFNKGPAKSGSGIAHVVSNESRGSDCPSYLLILTNHLLIASPELDNDFFAQSVVLVLEHSETNGAAGIVLNKPSEVPLEKIWPELDEDEFVRANELVHIGGPCDGPVVALHSCPECSEVAVLPGVAMAVKSNNLHRLMAQTDLWRRACEQYGNEIISSAVGQRIPSDPLVN